MTGDAQSADEVRPPGPEFVPPVGDERGVWIFWPAPDRCRWCNDEGIVHTHDGEIIGPCECTQTDGTDAPVSDAGTMEP